MNSIVYYTTNNINNFITKILFKVIQGNQRSLYQNYNILIETITKFEVRALDKLTTDFSVRSLVFKLTRNVDFTNQFQDQKQQLLVQYDENIVVLVIM